LFTTDAWFTDGAPLEDRGVVEPLPQTAEALRELARVGEESLGHALYAMSIRVRAVVPELVGLSLAVLEEDVTLTLVVSTEWLAGLDSVQYLDGGPCVAAADVAETLDVNVDDLLDEGRWQLYARASAAAGVASSLSLPVMNGSRVMGGVNLYAATPNAFAGKHDKVAEAIGSDAELAVANADLSFSTLKKALEAPARLREGGDINVALGIISQSQGVNFPIARERLRNAAARAGITEAQAARALKHIRSG
jgi:GAF domain-containing protein